MGRRKEYVESFTLTRDEADKLRKAQRAIREHGFENANKNELTNKLAVASGLLSFIYMLPTPVSLGAAIIASLSSIDDVRKTIIQLCKNGELYFVDLVDMFDKNPDYKSVKVRLPLLEFIDEGYRIVQGNGSIDKIIKREEPFPNAKTIEVDGAYRSGGISRKGEEDFYKFTVTKEGRYAIKTKGDTDTCGVLYDIDGQKLDSDDDGGSGSNFKIKEHLNPGIYYVKVYGYGNRETGLYSIKVYSY